MKDGQSIVGLRDVQDVWAIAEVVAGEARGEELDGQVAVAWVLRNRVGNPGWWGTTWQEVARQPFQFARYLNLTPELFAVAMDVYCGVVDDPTDGATHFFSGKDEPGWAKELQHTIDIGNHHFYRKRGSHFVTVN